MTAYLVFIAMHLTILLASIGTNTVSVAFGNITSDLHTSLVTSGWVMSIYLLCFTVSTALMGKISDKFGRKQTFVACNIIFVAGSLIAGIAPNIEILILARLIQSVGAGGFVPTTLGVITEMFPHSRQRMVGISISIFNIGGIIGPSIGAWLVSSYGWRSVFWFNVPFGILALIPVLILLKPDKRKSSQIDMLGAGYLAVALLGLMVGVSRISVNNSVLSWVIVAALVCIGLSFFMLFLRRTRKAKDPVVDPELLGRQPFLSVNIYNFIFGACVFSFSSFIPIFITSVYGLSTYQSGLILSIRSVGNIIASMAASFLVMNWSYRKQVMTGTILTSITIILLALEPRAFSLGSLYISDFTILSVLNLFSGMAMGVSAPAMINCLIDLMPEKTATISGIGSMFRQSGGAIFIAVITVIVQSSASLAYGYMASFLMVGIMGLFCLPFVFKIPERVKGNQMRTNSK
jgi:EmrB/QacA subfamily drug resistance transporter